jgi:hypothetical protein
MPFELSWEPEGVVRRYTGWVSPQDRRDSLELICADHRFDELRYAISDYRSVTGYEADAAAAVELAALHRGPLLTNPQIVIAAVTDRPDVIADIRTFIAQGVLSMPYRIFSDMAEARRWVGAPDAGPSDSRAPRPA